MSEVSERIQKLIDENDVVLFMKGTRALAKCAISARAIDVLTRCGAEVRDVDVLADAKLRDGVKEFSNWPRFPQAYIKGDFIGGTDILTEMYESGELQKLLGDGSEQQEATLVPEVTVTAAAQAAIKAAAANAGDDVLRLDVSTSFKHGLQFGPKRPDDLMVEAGGSVTVHLTPHSAKRANGVAVDYVDGPQGAGFTLDNPNAPKDEEGK